MLFEKDQPLHEKSSIQAGTAGQGKCAACESDLKATCDKSISYNCLKVAAWPMICGRTFNAHEILKSGMSL